jgi:phosphoribosylaminoimidazole-succinocarboxamide synthase
MISKQTIQKKLSSTLKEANLSSFGPVIKGKVRDSYVVGDKRILVSSDRFSAFDVILSTIPFKGELLTGLAWYWFEKTKHLLENHTIAKPHANVVIGKEVKIIPIEVVVRGFLAGSAWRDYQAGNPVSGVKLPDGLQKNQKLETPIITPSTKEAVGLHDIPISEVEIMSKGIVAPDIWKEVREKALTLFNFASEDVKTRGLYLLDTKFEFGLITDIDGKSRVILADEIFTQDCSRFIEMNSYEERMSKGEDPEMLDKEWIRTWLINKGYMGEGTPPEFTEEFRVQISEHYINAYERISGLEFTPSEKEISEEEIRKFL